MCKAANESVNNTADKSRYPTPAPITDDDSPLETGTEPEVVFAPLLVLDFEVVVVVLTNSKQVAATSGPRPEVATKSLKLNPIRYVNGELRLGEMFKSWFV